MSEFIKLVTTDGIYTTTGKLVEFLKKLPPDTPISEVFEFGFGKRGTILPIKVFSSDDSDKLYFGIWVDDWKLPPDMAQDFMNWVSCRGWIADNVPGGEEIYGKEFYNKVKQAAER